MTSINYSITGFIPLTRLQVRFDQRRALPHLTPRKHNLTGTKSSIALSVFVTTRKYPRCASARGYVNGLQLCFVFLKHFQIPLGHCSSYIRVS